MSDLRIVCDNMDREDGDDSQTVIFDLFGDLVSIGSEKREALTITLVELQAVCVACQTYLDKMHARGIRLTTEQ